MLHVGSQQVGLRSRRAFGLGLLRGFFREVDDLIVLPDVNGGAGLESEFERAFGRAAQGSQRVLYFACVCFFLTTHRFIPAEIKCGVFPELSYHSHVSTKFI